MYKTIFSKIFYEDVYKCHKYIKETLEAPMAIADYNEILKLDPNNSSAKRNIERLKKPE